MGGAKCRQSLASGDSRKALISHRISLGIGLNNPHMARTPIFGDIQRALRIAARLERSTTSTAEGLERLQEAAWSRRRFLRTAATVTAGAVLTPSFTQCCSPGQTPKVVIVGAGVAGLVCAYRLQQSGISARVIEASTRVGGRMFSLRNHFPDNQVAELGGELIDTEHTHLRNLAKELGLTVTDLAYDGGPNGHAYYFDDRRIHIDNYLIDLFRPVGKAILADLDQMKVDNKIDYDTPHGREVDKLSIEQWLKERDVTGMIADVLQAAYRGENGLELGDQSALNLITAMEDEKPGDDFNLFGGSDERYHIAEGNDSVPTRLAQHLKREVELGNWLEAISRNGRGYSLALRRDNATKVVDADVVVLAIPFTTLRKVRIEVDLPPLQRQAINELGYGTNAKLMTGLSKRVWEQMTTEECRADNRFTGYTFSNLPFQCCWETSRGQPGTHAILTNFLGGNAGKDLCQEPLAVRASDFVKQVDEIYPGVQAAFTGQAVRQHWPSSPFVIGSYTCFRPGQYTTLKEHRGTPFEKIFFAGEHTSENSGFMEGGVESGERAANEILAAIGHRRARAKAA
jgi:monoamine oxidase